MRTVTCAAGPCAVNWTCNRACLERQQTSHKAEGYSGFSISRTHGLLARKRHREFTQQATFRQTVITYTKAHGQAGLVRLEQLEQAIQAALQVAPEGAVPIWR